MTTRFVGSVEREVKVKDTDLKDRVLVRSGDVYEVRVNGKLVLDGACLIGGFLLCKVDPSCDFLRALEEANDDSYRRQGATEEKILEWRASRERYRDENWDQKRTKKEQRYVDAWFKKRLNPTDVAERED